jgi:hypothetical protein
MNDWERGCSQAVEEVMSEIHERSPTMASAIMNKYPAWKVIMLAARDRANNQLTLKGK